MSYIRRCWKEPKKENMSQKETELGQTSMVIGRGMFKEGEKGLKMGILTQKIVTVRDGISLGQVLQLWQLQVKADAGPALCSSHVFALLLSLFALVESNFGIHCFKVFVGHSVGRHHKRRGSSRATASTRIAMGNVPALLPL